MACSPRSDHLVRVLALDCQGERDEFDLGSTLQQHGSGGWRNYVRA